MIFWGSVTAGPSLPPIMAAAAVFEVCSVLDKDYYCKIRHKALGKTSPPPKKVFPTSNFCIYPNLNITNKT